MPVISIQWFPEHVNAIKGDSGLRVGPASPPPAGRTAPEGNQNSKRSTTCPARGEG
jgi:hypothetical protein